MSGAASRISLRSRANIWPRQSASSAICWSIRSDGFMYFSLLFSTSSANRSMVSVAPSSIPDRSIPSTLSLGKIVPCEIVEVKHTHGLTDQLPLAAMQPQGEVLPIHDAAHDAFMTLPAHTSSRKNEVQPVVAGASSLLLQAWMQSGGLCGTKTRKQTKGMVCYGTTTDCLPPATGNSGALATPLSGASRITPRPVGSVLPASGDHPGAGPASATAPRGTHAHDTAYARAATDPAGTGDLQGSV